jgi:O-antigen ligase
MRAPNPGQMLDRALARNQAALIVVGCGAALLGVALAAVGQASLSLMFGLLAALVAWLMYLARQETLLAGVIVAVAIFVDFYQIIGLPLRQPVMAVALSAALLAILFFTQSDARPWQRIPQLGFWTAFVALAMLGVPRGPMTQTGFYFLTVIVGPFLLYLLGTQVARNPRQLTWLVALVSGIAVFVAAHSIVQGLTGVFLFATLRQVDYLSSVSGFHLAGVSIERAGSFLENPDWNGAYLALSFFPLVGLFLMARQTWARVLAAVGATLILIALLFTFTTASWLALVVGIGVLLWRVIPRRYLKRSLIAIGVTAFAFIALFSFQLRLLFAHATANREITLRLGAWETALRVIQAHPLTGLGMSQSIYLVAAEPYRVAWQTRPLAHPHDTYLELAAFAGIPVLLAFLALLVMTLRAIARQWRLAPAAIQPVIGGIFTALIVLSVNSLFINGWTLPPIAGVAWLLAGAAMGRFREAPKGGAAT